MLKSTTQLKRRAPSELLAGLRSENTGESKEAAVKLMAEAKSYGLPLRDFLRLAADPRLEATEEARRPFLASANDNGGFINGYEATLAYLHLPVRDDLDGGIMLQAAADTFQTFPGTRMLFPEVIDDMVKWRYRQTNFETTDPMIAQRRTVSGVEMISTVVLDEAADYEESVRAVSERGRVPIHAIETSQNAVKFWKFGNGYSTTYEFQRRATLDILTPYAQRTQRQIEKGKVSAATWLLINGDGVHSAAPVVNQSSFNSKVGENATAGKLSFKHLCAWLVSRAQAGAPIDVVLGNWDMYLVWLFMFALPTSDKSITDAEQLARTGFQLRGVPILQGTVDFVLSSDVPAGQLIGYSKADTLEELIEAGSLINESERSINTQEVTYVRTENSGYRLVFGDTRSIFDVDA